MVCIHIVYISAHEHIYTHILDQESASPDLPFPSAIDFYIKWGIHIPSLASVSFSAK